MGFAEMLQHFRAADAVMTHAGVGSILCARRAGHVPVVVPRQRRDGEHVDDHQVELTRALEERQAVHCGLAEADRLTAVASARDCRARSSASDGRLPQAAQGCAAVSGRVLALCYHGVSERWPAPTAGRRPSASIGSWRCSPGAATGDRRSARR